MLYHLRIDMNFKKAIYWGLYTYFGCQPDEPYGFPGDHNASMYLLIVNMNFCYCLLLCSVGNKTNYYYYYYYYYYVLSC